MEIKLKFIMFWSLLFTKISKIKNKVQLKMNYLLLTRNVRCEIKVNTIIYWYGILTDSSYWLLVFYFIFIQISELQFLFRVLD